MPDVSEILDITQNRSPEGDKLIKKAFSFAQNAHEGQTRYSGDPYFIHLVETAKNLAELGMSPTTIAAGLLHDSIEDAEITPQELTSKFGDEISFLVEGVTKLDKIRYRGTKRHIGSLRKLFVAISQDLRVLIIKLADRLHNIETLKYVPQDKQKRIAVETLEIYAPIAYRLGIRKLSRALEDGAFPYVYPKEYTETLDLLTSRKNTSDKNLEKFIRTLRKTLAENNMRNAQIDYRMKGIFSLYKKLKRKGKDIEKIYDIAAVRIVLPTVADCYRALGIIHGVWRPLPGRIKDYIAFTKPNGYQSIHTTVFCGDGSIIEVQIKTEKMHRDAEYGVASHIYYKAGKKKKNNSFAWITHLLPNNKQNISHDASLSKASKADIPTWIRDLVEYRDDNLEEQNIQKEIKGDFFEHRIFVFTPLGDVVDLPIDSSPVDFAYAIHSDIGDHLSGAKVNGKLMSLDTSLKNGDIVEIITKKNVTPSTKWLEYAKTATAQKRIRNAT